MRRAAATPMKIGRVRVSRARAHAGTIANPYRQTDPYRLSRSPIQSADGMRWFRRKAAGGLSVEDGLRRIANRGRYAGAVT